MGKGCCVFVSDTGEMLPRWQEAFPAAQGIAFLKRDDFRAVPSMVWLRLSTGMTVAEQVALMRLRFDHAPTIVLSDIPNDDEAIAAFSAAARGYCNAHANAEILKQIEAVVSLGGLWMGETLVHRLVGALDKVAVSFDLPERDWKAILTDREHEVAQAVCSGASNKEIAQQLGITERTVKAHIGATFEKLNVRDRLQLALLVKGL